MQCTSCIMMSASKRSSRDATYSHPTTAFATDWTREFGLESELYSETQLCKGGSCTWTCMITISTSRTSFRSHPVSKTPVSACPIDTAQPGALLDGVCHMADGSWNHGAKLLIMPTTLLQSPQSIRSQVSRDSMVATPPKISQNCCKHPLSQLKPSF
mgnify:CR=1 FL=1